MSHPRKNPKKLEKTSIFNTCQTIPDTPKTNLFHIKTSKNKPKKNTILPCSKTTHYFLMNFLFISTYSFCFWKTVFCWKQYKNSVFRKHSFSKTQLVKPTFSTMSKKHPFPKKGVIFAFLQFPLETPIFIVFPALHCFGPKKILAKTDSVHKNAAFFFSLPDTNSVRKFLLKIHFFDFSHFWMTTLKTLFL